MKADCVLELEAAIRTDFSSEFAGHMKLNIINLLESKKWGIAESGWNFEKL